MRAIVVLPAPDSPTIASDEPASSPNETILDGHQVGAVAHVKALAQVFDLEQRRAGVWLLAHAAPSSLTPRSARMRPCSSSARTHATSPPA